MYAARYLQAYGEKCEILRTSPVESYVSLRPSNRRTGSLSSRANAFEGLILSSSGLESGDVLCIGDQHYLVQIASRDPASREIAWFGVLVNATVTHKRLEKSIDDDGNITGTWKSLNSDVMAYGEVVTPGLRQYDPGLLDSTRYVFCVPAACGVQVEDRLGLNGTPLRVLQVDDILMPGVVRVQCGADVRP
jgi:hypothetical protein